MQAQKPELSQLNRMTCGIHCSVTQYGSIVPLFRLQSNFRVSFYLYLKEWFPTLADVCF